MTLEDVFASKIKIIKALRRAGEPLIAQHIAKRSRLSPQLVSYHLEQMVDWGIITTSSVEDKSFYQLQKPYCNEELLEILSDTLIPFMSKISTQMNFSQIKVSSTEAVIRNLFMFLRLFETEIQKLPFNNDNRTLT
ncbi:winged helix-turn-helix domain-containing protein [Candidatus Bathyarchaeota archaeon]|nr:winged helix-turn-helix domain-containing protein [Candidatus Bathyarchaeota archaeon]